jgi:peptidoglycan/xylan/chitin deacetylase (PgdA/CDA1 family)
VENHSWDHPHFTGIPSSAVSSQIVRTQEAILAAGAPAPTLFRFPYSSTNPSLNSQLQSVGLTIMGYSIDTNDWRGIPPNAIVSAVLDHATDGAVVVMHDGVRASVHTVEALPQILSGLQTRGFCTELATRVRPPDPGIKPLVGE